MALAIQPHDSDRSRRRRVLVPMAIAVFVLIWGVGAAAFYSDSVHAGQAGDPAHGSHGVGECLYRSLQLFHFHDTHWPHHHGGGYEFARFAAAGYSLGLPLVVLGWFCRGGVRRWWHKRPWNRGFFVVVGDSAPAACLAEDMARGGRPVVLVSTRDERDVAGVLQIDGPLHQGNFWRDEAGIFRAAAVIIMHEDDVENVRCSAVIEEVLARRRKNSRGKSPALPVHVHLRNLHLKKGLVSLLPAGDAGGLVDRRYFSRFEIMARLLAREYPLPGLVVGDEALPEHYVIVGFGAMGQNIALKLVKMGQQVVRRRGPDGDHFEVCRPRVTVIDQRGEKAAEEFLRSHPGFTSTCEFQVVACAAGDREFLELQFLRPEDAASRCSIIFCLDDETLVTTTILMILDSCERPDKDVDAIYFHCPTTEGVGQLLNRRTQSSSVPVTPFAPDAQVFTADIILNQSLDLMAALVQDAYLGAAARMHDPANIPPAASKTWQQLTPDEKEGTRESADHMWAKVRTLGFDLTSVPYDRNITLPVADDSAALAQLIDREMEALAAAEHCRWMAWRLIDGWTHGNVRDNQRKLHPDIKAYEDLADEVKEKDRVMVRLIPRLIKAGRLLATRIERT